ncbi:MAG: hypothetical protein ACMUIE_06840, partial [Thermoplasmatota archaeon]
TVPVPTPTLELTKTNELWIDDDGSMDVSEGDTIRYTYEVENTGNAPAYNVTVEIVLSNMTAPLIISVGNLTEVERYPGTLQVNTSLPQELTINITADWDQNAPVDLKVPVHPFGMELEIIQRPDWTGHRVFVEMFTQTTCAPCVNVEETLEVLYHEGELDFEFVVYVLEDEESAAKADELGLEGTPELFVDNGAFSKSGSDGFETDMTEIRSLIENASRSETAPVSARFSFMDEGSELSLSLPFEYRDAFSGSVVVYVIEPLSNLRNYQGIPIAHRYMGVQTSGGIENLEGGSYQNMTIPLPPEGMGYLAVVTTEGGDVVQSASFFPYPSPGLFLKEKTTPVLRLETPGEVEVEMTLESFAFEADNGGTADVEFKVVDLPSGWTAAIEGSDLGAGPRKITFDPTLSEREILPVGRLRLFETYTITIGVPENISGTFDLAVNATVGDYEYTRTAVVIASLPDGGDGWPPVVTITDFYLQGEGRSIFIYMEAQGVPENATVKCEVLPCNYEGNQLCGLPREFILLKVEDGLYKAPVNQVDLETFTHLTYYVWIEVEGLILADTSNEKKTVEISDLIDIQGDDDDEDGVNPLVIILSIGIPIVIIVLVAIVFLVITQRKKEEEEEAFQFEEREKEDDASEDEEEVEDQEDVSDGSDEGEQSPTHPEPEETGPEGSAEPPGIEPRDEEVTPPSEPIEGALTGETQEPEPPEVTSSHQAASSHPAPTPASPMASADAEPENEVNVN